MARVLIGEPHGDVRALLTFVVERMGHDAVVLDGARDQLLGVDVFVFEPGHAPAYGLAAWARDHAPGVRLVCTSIYPPGHDTDALDPDAYLVKPFPLERLERALAQALRRDLAHV